ncbi:MAG: BON domain-containing protein, partial [Bryocella sp.]
MTFASFSRCAGGILLAGSLSLAAGAQSATIPDAQVESNVLRQLATAPELSTQNIQTTTVYGVVTLTGNVHDEATRSKVDDLVARSR